MIVVDSGPLLAIATPTDRYHDVCSNALASAHEPLVVSPFVIVEVAHLLNVKAGPTATAAFVRSLADGSLVVPELVAEDFERSASLIETYASLNIGLVDASVIALAERLDIKTVMTVDRRHFTVVRPRHVAAFELVPDIG
jgi:predicted nucleic acid-binding protein